MSVTAGSVSHWIVQAGHGDELAFEKLHQRYRPQVVGLARQRLHRAPCHLNDAEDVAQRAFMDLFRCFRQGRVPELNNRHQLLALLSHIVACRVLNEIRASGTKRRGGTETIRRSLDCLLSGQRENEPLQQAMLKECYEIHVLGLPVTLRPFAEMYLAGFSNREIAEHMSCVERTVERKVSMLRWRWQKLAAESLQENSDSAWPQHRRPSDRDHSSTSAIDVV